MFDGDTLPAASCPLLADALQRDFDVAGERNAAATCALACPAAPPEFATVVTTGPQVRPEWGLAGNGAFIIGPRCDHRRARSARAERSCTATLTRALDPDGVALETIMTAPLVVAQWISSQYYFSTVEPDLFGAGDKMLHNPVGGIGVVIGQSGDLAVGLPMQSVMLGEQRAHDPLRLLAVVQAPLERDRRHHRTQSTGCASWSHGEWIHVVARATEQRCMVVQYSTGGSWMPWHPADSAEPNRTADTISDTISGLAHADLSIATLDLTGRPMTDSPIPPTSTPWTDLPAMAKIEVVVEGRRRARCPRPLSRRRAQPATPP
jgi:uncharacterized protein